MKDEWRLDVEESVSLLRIHGVLAMVNLKNQKIYVKPVSHSNGFIELKILTIQELKDLKIEIQESCLNGDFDIEIQESEFTNAEVQRRFEEEQRKKGLGIPLKTVSDAEKAIEIAQKAKEILERKTPSTEELQEENEDLKGKLEMVALKELDRRINLLGIKDSELIAKFHEDPSIFRGYEQRMKEEMGQNYQVPSGSAPLNSQQYGSSGQAFSSQEEMIKHLRMREREGDQEAKTILRKLFEKTVRGMKERNSIDLPMENVNPKAESSSDSNVKEVTVSINAINPKNEPSEVEKFNIGKRKRRDDD